MINLRAEILNGPYCMTAPDLTFKRCPILLDSRHQFARPPRPQCASCVRQQMLVTVSHPRQWALTPHNELNVPDRRRIGNVGSRGGEGGLLVLTGIAFLTGAISEVSYWLLDTFPMLGKIG
jgi:hypothetical protein